MEDVGFIWLDGDYALNYNAPDLLILGSPQVNPADSPAAEGADQLSGEHVRPVLRLSDWDSNKLYDKNNPQCIPMEGLPA